VNDDRSNHPDRDGDRDEPATGRRAVWSRRVALVLLIGFAAFVVLNVAVVLALLLRNLAPGGGPFGN